MGDIDELEQRLRELGREPVHPALQEHHLSAMRSAAARALEPVPAEQRWRFGWRAVAAAGIAGFLAGSTGLAAAGALPDPAQNVAHDVLGAVGLDVPRSTEGCPEGRTYRNHGQYVSEVEAAGGDVEAAAHSDCGKPLHAGRGNGGGNGGGGGGGDRPAGQPRPDTDGDPCTGPPPWAGAHLPREQRDALKEERRALCGDDEDEAGEVEDEAGEVEDESPPPVEEPTTTTVPSTDATPTTEATTSTTAIAETTSTTAQEGG